MGLALALIFGLSPLSVCGFLLICSFWPVKGNCRCCRRCPFSGRACYSFSIILRTLGRRVKRAGAAYTVLTILTVPIKFFLRLLVIIKKARIIKGFRRLRACFFVVFWYTIIARSVHNYRTCGIQNSHGKYTKIARPVMAVCLRL